MTTKRTFSPDESPKALGPYNHGVQVGNLLFSAGQIPVDPDTGQLVEGDITTQTARVLDNLNIILQSQGLQYENVVKTTIFLTDLTHFAAVNTAYAERFTHNCPARSTVQVAALPLGALVEIEMIAHF